MCDKVDGVKIAVEVVRLAALNTAQTGWGIFPGSEKKGGGGDERIERNGKIENINSMRQRIQEYTQYEEGQILIYRVYISMCLKMIWPNYLGQKELGNTWIAP